MYKKILTTFEMTIVEDANGKRGIVDANSNLIVPCMWNDIRYPEWDWEFLVQGSDGRWGVVSQQAEIIVEPIWHSIKTFHTLGYSVNNGEGDFGHILPSCKTLLKCRYVALQYSNLDVILDCQWKEVTCTEYFIIVRNDEGLLGIFSSSGIPLTECKWIDV